MADRRREKVRTVSARERAKRLGWRVDPPDDLDDDPSHGEPVAPPRQRPTRDATVDGWGRR